VSLIGYVDVLTKTCIAGWVADDADFARQLFVDIFVNNLLVASIRGGGFRDDLRQAGLGDGCKSFQFDPTFYLQPGRNEIVVRHAGTEFPVARGQAVIADAVEESEAGPLLAHIHVPKCAGTSFRVLLERYFGPRHVRLYMDDTYFVYSEEALRNCLLRDPLPRAFSSHHVRTFPSRLGGREMLYVTFLRDPVEQFVSYMTHVRKHYSGITSRTLLESLPPNAPQLTLREFAHWLLTQDRDIPFRENHNVNFFARHSAPAEADRLEAAKAALSRFFFVGISDRMDESMEKLRALAQGAGLEFPADALSVENTSGEFRDDLGWIDPADEVGAMLLHSVERDRRLYDWAVERFDAIGQSPRNRLELSVGLA
jgi:hypothetical protein